MGHTERFFWNAQIVGMGILVSLSCGLIGSFIVARKLALMGDAISHGILPGLAIAFIATQSKALFPMFIGACLAGLLCSFCIEWLHKKTPLSKWMRHWGLHSLAFLLWVFY